MGSYHGGLGTRAASHEVEESKASLEAQVEELLGGRPKSFDNVWWTGWQAQAEEVIGNLVASSEDDCAMLAQYVSREEVEAQELDQAIAGKQHMTELSEGATLLNAALENLTDKFQQDFDALQEATDQVWSSIQRISEDQDIVEAKIELDNLQKSPDFERLLSAIRNEESEQLAAWQSAVMEISLVGRDALSALADVQDIEIETSSGLLDELESLQRGPQHPEQEHQKELQSLMESSPSRKSTPGETTEHLRELLSVGKD